MHSNRPVLSKLLLSLVHLSEEVYEAFSALRHVLFRPVRELELTHCARGAVAGVCHLRKVEEC